MENNSEIKNSNTSLSSIEHHLNAVKQEDYSASFQNTSGWLYKAGIQMTNKEQTSHLNERKLYRMKNFFFANKLRLVYTIVVLALIIGACNMPVTQTDSAGTIIALTVPGDNTDFAAKMNALPWIKNAQVSSNENINNGNKQVLYTIMLPNSNEEQAKKYADELESLGGVETIRIRPINYDVKRPLYSAALHDFFSLDINASGKSDPELEIEMEQKLKEQGIDMDFTVTTNSDGRREIKLVHDDKIDMNKDPQMIEMNIEDNNGQEKIKMMTKKADPKQFEGKTDKEIREMVRKDSGNPNLTDDQIKITRDGGKVQVKVEVEQKK